MVQAHDAGPIFRHGIASGDPTHHEVVIWTRVTQPGSEDASTSAQATGVPVTWSVAADPDLRDVVAHGITAAEADRDWTVHVDVTGLEPDAQYFYWFGALGETSPVGRTKTLPETTDHLRLAMVSCAKYNAGFFNAFARIADRTDLNPERVKGEWWLVDTVLKRSSVERLGASWTVERGLPKLLRTLELDAADA